VRRVGLLLLACSLAGAALAQSSSTGERQFQAGREADLNQWRWTQTQRNRTLTEGEKAVQAVSAAIALGDCVAAASALNAELAKAHPEVWMVAGAMFEEGLCLKANWECTLNFYQRADVAGQPGAAARLAVGYATPAGGRDLAAQSELLAPDLAASLGLQGTIRIVFMPVEARIDFSDDLAAAGGVVADATTRDAEARATRAALQEQLRQTADRALKRLAKPQAVPASWRVETQHALRLAR
jgi:hypothetical protein